MKVVLYQDGVGKEISGYRIVGFDKTAGTKEITVIYGTMLSTSFMITVEHNWGSGNITKAPNCSEEGEATYTCDYCKKTKTETLEITEHNYIKTEAVAPTCTEHGLTEGKYCTICGDSNIEYIPQLNHETVIKSRNATYFKNGYKNREICKKCKSVFSKGEKLKQLILDVPELTVINSKNKLAVKYSRVKDASGYQVKYKAGKFVVKLTYNSPKAANKVYKQLKSGLYIVKVRSFKRIGDQTVFSDWAKAKNIEI